MSHKALFKGRRFDRDGTPSNSSSRAQSVSRTPLRSDDSDYESDAEEQDYIRIEELLREKLSNLHQQEVELSKEDRISAGDRRQHEALSLNRARIQESSSINDIISSLEFSRNDVSLQSRELLLAQLYKIIVSKSLVVYNEEHTSTPDYVDEDKVSKLINVFTTGNYRSELEFLYLYRALVALICSDIEEFGVLVSTELLNHIEKLITEPANSIVTNENKAQVISGYVTLTLVLHSGASSFGIEDRVAMLMEIGEGYTASATTLKKEVESGDREHSTFITDKNLDKKLINEANSKVNAEASVAVAAIHGVGCLLTLLPQGAFLNEIVEDLMFKLVPLLDNDEDRDIAKAAGRTIGVIYELYDYRQNDDEVNDENYDEDYNVNSPYYEQESLLAILTRLLNLSSKKVAKKDKKDISSVFRNISNTIHAYTNPKDREQIYKRTPDGLELLETTTDLIYIKLSKYRSLKINSWFLYFRLKQLRWCFSFGLHNQLVSNESIRDVLKEPENEFHYGTQNEIDESLLDDDNSEFLHEYMDQKHSNDEKTRNAKRKKDRMVKIGEQLEELNLTT
ncbi:MAG: IFRD domain-containing protein [Asgard group archaeon]|nr:IFRD domain-containing protein [Asgard group archaeon]